MKIGRAGVPVADGDAKEFKKATCGMVTGVGDDRRHDHLRPNGGRDLWHVGGWGDGQLGSRVGHRSNVT